MLFCCCLAFYDFNFLGDVIVFSQPLLLSEARYLTGEEQKGFCQVLLDVAKQAVADTTFRCVVLKQTIKEIENPSGECTYEVTVISEISSDASDILTTLTSKFNTEKDNIVTTLKDDDVVFVDIWGDIQ